MMQGSIDETERSFMPAERRLAEKFAAEGRMVKALKEGENVGRSADAEVDQVSTEFKSLLPGADNNTVRRVVNNSLRRGGQARQIIVDARESGLEIEEAKRGARRVFGITRGRLDRLRIIGIDFDIEAVYPSLDQEEQGNT